MTKEEDAFFEGGWRWAEIWMEGGGVSKGTKNCFFYLTSLLDNQFRGKPKK